MDIRKVLDRIDNLPAVGGVEYVSDEYSFDDDLSDLIAFTRENLDGYYARLEELEALKKENADLRRQVSDASGGGARRARRASAARRAGWL